MKQLCFTLALAGAISASAQELSIVTSDNALPTRVAVKELLPMTHENVEGHSAAHIDIFTGAEYVANPATVEQITYLPIDDALYQGKYADMIRINDKKIDELKPGDVIGVFAQQDFSKDEFSSEIYQNIYGMESLFQLAYSKNFLLTAASFRGIQADLFRIRVADIVYVSQDIDGSNIALSGRVIYPYYAYSDNFTIKEIYVDNHTSLFGDDTAPSNSFSGTPFSGLVSRGAAVVQPDLIGFGASTMRTQIYIDYSTNGRYAADCLVAAREFLTYTKKDNNKKFKKANLSTNLTSSLYGGSQGGFTSMAMLKYIETEMPKTEKAKVPTIKDCHLYAAPWNPVYSLRHYCANDTSRYAPAFLLIIQGTIAAHPDIMTDEAGNVLTPHDFFDPQLETKEYDFSIYDPNRTTPMTIWQLMQSKDYTSSMLIGELAKEYGELLDTGFEGVTFGFIVISKMLASEVLKEVDDPYHPGQTKLTADLENPKFVALIKALEESNLNKPEEWVPNSNIYLVHGIDDRWVPYQNSVDFFDNMGTPMAENKKVLSLESLEDVSAVGGHGVTCFVWMLSELLGVPTTATLSVIKSMKESQSSTSAEEAYARIIAQ